MRIQHNILSMNAYRNYSNNTSALGKNLEKLSSGYKINRAGDDAAGLAISEKMRAQIQGLNAAQKNVKDGISFVKTAEGAMQEIQDMLSRMKYLATQSANGTYNDDVDREALQDEVDSLLTEIDRIADSANFNDIYMLSGGGAAKDGNVQAGDTDASGANAGIMLTANPGISMAALKPSAGSGTKVDVAETGSVGAMLATNGSKTGASFAGKTMEVTFTTGSGSKAVTQKVKIGFGTGTAAATGVQVHVKITASASNAAVFKALSDAVTEYGKGLAANNAAQSAAGTYLDGITVAQASGGLKFTGTFRAYEVDSTQSTGSGSTAKVPANTKVEIDLSKIDSTKNFASGDSITIGDTTYTFGAAKASGTTGASNSSVMPAAANVTVTLGTSFADSMKNLVAEINKQKDTTGIEAAFADGKLNLTTTQEFDSVDDFRNAVNVTVTAGDADLKRAVEDAWKAGVDEAVKNLDGGDTYDITLQIGDTSKSYNQLTMKIRSMKVESLGVKDLKINHIKDAQDAIQTIKDAINIVSSTRGKLGAYQNRLEHTANNLSVMTENITDAESTIRDTDVADEMMAYTKNNILIQSAQAMLAQANAVPQGVLQLLQ